MSSKKKGILKEIFQYKDLLFMLTFRDIRIRYKQAMMGFMWAVFMPMMAVLAGILVKKAISIVSGQPMDFKGVLSITVKVLPWTFFVGALKFSVNSLVGNMNLVTKIYFPREVLPLSSVLASLFDFFIASLTLAVLLILAQIGISIHILFLPLLIIFLLLYTAGLGLLLSCANLFYRDVKYIVEIILMFGIFFTPIFYQATTFGKWKVLLLLNPIASILEGINAIVVDHTTPELFWLIYGCFISLAVFLIGLKIFHKYEPLFAENI